MKTCPHCKINVGGQADYCPLCQNPLIGTGAEAHWPGLTPQTRRRSLLYKLVVFVLLGVTIACAAVDFVWTEGPHSHGSILVAVWVVAILWLLHTLLYRRINGPRLFFQLFVLLSLLAVFTDAFVGLGGISVDLVVPLLCSTVLVVNFIFAFVKTRFTENALVYLLLNIVIGVLPDLLMLFQISSGRLDGRTIPWLVCFIISLITFLGLIIFKGRTLRVELEKRLHL